MQQSSRASVLQSIHSSKKPFSTPLYQAAGPFYGCIEAYPWKNNPIWYQSLQPFKSASWEPAFQICHPVKGLDSINCLSLSFVSKGSTPTVMGLRLRELRLRFQSTFKNRHVPVPQKAAAHSLQPAQPARLLPLKDKVAPPASQNTHHIPPSHPFPEL